MQKAAVLFVMFLMLSLLVMCRIGPGEITGKISTINGEIPPKMHVHIYKYEENPYKPLYSAAAKADGSFKIEMPDETKLELMVTAAGFPRLIFPVMNQHRKDVLLDIKLNYYEYIDELEDVKLIGSWDKFSEENPVSMTPAEDSTWFYNVISGADTVGYQLYNIVKSNRSVNGTMWDKLIYDQGGDYISVIYLKDNRGRIVFDPRKLPEGEKENTPQVQVEGGDLSMQPFIDISMRMQRETVRITDSAAVYKEKNEGIEGFQYNIPDFTGRLVSYIKQEKDTLLAKYASLQLAKIWNMGAEIKEEDLRKASSKLPLTDNLWEQHPVLCVRLFTYVFKEEAADSLFREKVELIQYGNVKAAVLLQLGLKAKADNKILDLVGFYKQLVRMRIDLPNYKYLLAQLNPDKNIFKGKDIPDFSFSLLNSGKHISNKSFLGKYYLMDFWATWHEPYMNEMAVLHSAYDKYKSKNFTILSLSYDINRTSIDKFLKGRWKMPWMHVFVNQIMKKDISKVFEVGGIPMAILVGPDGKILATDLELRGENLEKTLAKYIK